MEKTVRRIDTDGLLCEKRNERLSTFIQSTNKNCQGRRRNHAQALRFRKQARNPAGKDGGSI